MYAYMNVCIYVSTYISKLYVSIYVCKYVFKYVVCMYIWMYSCIHVSEHRNGADSKMVERLPGKI